MARLTKAQRQELERTRYNLERGIAFLKSPRIEVCMQTNFPGKQDYLAHDGKTGVTPLNIEIGSDIVGFYHALKIVNELLADY